MGTAAKLPKAAETGARDDFAEATRQISRALMTDIGLKIGR